MAMENNIKLFRAKLGYTQEDLAKKANVTRQTIIALEKGSYTPSLELAFKLSDLFQVPIEEIFYRTEGIMPQFLKDREIAYEGLTSMTIVETMAERKTAMLEQGDLFIALPGGLGTLEEISEAIAAARVGKLDKPCVFFNLNGYYDAMKTMLDTMVAHDFLEAETAAKFLFTDDFSEIEAFVQSYEPPQLRRYR